MKKYRLIDLAKGKLRMEDKCAALSVAHEDSEVRAAIGYIYSMSEG